MRHLVIVSILVAVLVVAPLGADSPYFLITPGGTYDIGFDYGSRLSIPDEHRKPMGRMAFTAVYETPATWGEVLHTRVAGQAEMVPAVYIRPPGTTQEQVNATNARLIDESKPVAAVVGLRAAGYQVNITGQGAEVDNVIRGYPADGVLQVNDIIVGVDGHVITTTDSLVQAITSRHVGDHLRLSLRRGDQPMDVDLATAAAPDDATRPIIGVNISTYMYDVQMPFPVDIQSDNVGGPSAGFMFALAVLDGVSDGDLSRGYYVAGTGTIAQDGTIGAVGGAAEKALAAEQAGAQIFLVPTDDAAEANRWVHNIRIIPVATFSDAIKALCGLPVGPEPAAPDTPSPCNE
jgi:Lon-like protease